MIETNFLYRRNSSFAETPEGVRYWAYLQALQALWSAAGKQVEVSGAKLPPRPPHFPNGGYNHA